MCEEDVWGAPHLGIRPILVFGTAFGAFGFFLGRLPPAFLPPFVQLLVAQGFQSCQYGNFHHWGGGGNTHKLGGRGHTNWGGALGR